MKPVSINLQLRPFDMQPGRAIFVPGSYWVCQIYPAKVSFFSFVTKESGEAPLPLQGPVKNFHVQVDLEKGHIEVSGIAEQGFFRFFIHAKKGRLFLEKKKGIVPSMLLGQLPNIPIAGQFPALSLGIHKKQDWALISRRCDPAEFLPFWLRWSYWIPPTLQKKEGVNPLLKELLEASTENVHGHLQKTFLGCFYDMFIPREDDGGLALLSAGVQFQGDLLQTLHEGAKYIERCFLCEEEGGFRLLATLPAEFHAGRFIRFFSQQGDKISMEWSKKKIRRIFFSCGKTRWIQWKVGSSQKSCRFSLKGFLQEGSRVLLKKPLFFEAGRDYCLDNFFQ